MQEQIAIKKYINTLREATQPLYEYQKKNICKQLKANIQTLKDLNIYDDIKYLPDKELCEIYNLKPADINLKYIGLEINELKYRAKTDIEHMEAIAIKQLKPRNFNRKN